MLRKRYIHFLLLFIFANCSNEQNKEELSKFHLMNDWIFERQQKQQDLIYKIDTNDEKKLNVRFFLDSLPSGEFRSYNAEGKLLQRGFYLIGEYFGYNYFYDSLNNLTHVKRYFDMGPNQGYLQEYIRYDSTKNIDLARSFYVECAILKKSRNSGEIIIQPRGIFGSTDSTYASIKLLKNDIVVKSDSIFFSDDEFKYEFDSNDDWNNLQIKLYFISWIEFEGKTQPFRMEVIKEHYLPLSISEY